MLVGSQKLKVVRYIHLRIKDTRLSLNNTHSLIESLQGVGCALHIRHHSSQIQLQILRVQLGGKAIAQAITRACRDFDVVPCGSQVGYDLRTIGAHGIRPKRAANEDDTDRLWLSIGEGEQGLSRVAVDKLDTEDLRLWEGCRDLHGKVG